MRDKEKIKFLERENELLNSIIQGASDSIYAKDLEGRYITINEAGATILGFTVDGVIGKRDDELMGEFAESILARDRLLFRTGENVVYESKIVKDGRTKHFWTSKSPLRGSKGEVIGLIGVSRDISDVKEVEGKYKFIFENAPIAFWEEDFSEVARYFNELRKNGVIDIRAFFSENPNEVNKCVELVQVLDVNRATLEMNGAESKDVFLSQLHQNFTPDSENIFLDEFEALFNGETTFRAEGSFVNQQGKVLDVIFTLSVLPGYEESLSMVVVSVLDLTDSRRLVSELSSIKHRYQSIVEAQSEMICRINPDGKIQFRNLAFIKFFGFKDKQEKTRFSSLFPPAEIDKCQKELAKLSASKPNTVFELRNYDVGGLLVWQEWSVTAFYGNSGILLGYQAVGSDVTTRKMAQEALAASEARWRSIFEHADDLIITFNTDGYILSINDYKGLPPKLKLAGRKIGEVLTAADAAKALSLLHTVSLNAGPLKTEMDLDISRNGKKTTFGIALSPITHGKRVISIICIARDITETKRLEKQTKEALIEGQEKERTRVSQELHDGLGQLFTAIKLNLQQIRVNADVGAQDPLIESVDTLETNIGIAFNEVRNISRNLMPDVLRQFGLKPAVEDLVNSWNAASGPLISLEMIDMEIRFSNDLEKALFRICQELINNSARHANCANIFVQFINHGASLVLIVEDDGVGFDVLKQHAGFGLQNINSRVLVFEGTVETDSSPGKGTVTTIEIPLNFTTEYDQSSNSR